MRRVVLVLLAVVACSKEPPPSSSGAASATPSAAVAAASAPPSAPPSASDAGSGPAATELERARRGDLDAIKRLDKLPAADRSVDQCTAIAEGHDVLLLRDLEQLGKDARLAQDPSLLARLFDFASDPRAALKALPIVASLPGTLAADMLHAVASESRHPATRSLAEDLLKTRAVRDRASKALDVALDLAATDECRALLGLLPKVRKHGDERAAPRLRQLGKKVGCGEKRRDDCFPCLRDDDLLEQTYAAVRKVDAPRPWVLERR